MAMLLAATACTAREHPPAKPTTGVVTGSGSPCVGPYVPHPHYVVHVTLTDAANTSQLQNLEAPYTFLFVVPPGAYTLSEPGSSPVTVHVEAGRTVSAHLIAICT